MSVVELQKKNVETILKHYGRYPQIVKTIEELSELQKELCKYLNGKENEDYIIEELADVYVMLMQMRYLFDTEDKVLDEMKYKIDRTIQRIESEKANEKNNWIRLWKRIFYNIK